MSHRLWFFVLGFLVWGGSFFRPAMAANSSRLATALRTVQSLYSQKQWSQVVTQAQRALNMEAPGNYAEQQASLNMYFGAALYWMKHPGLAASAFERALKLDSSAKLPPGADARLQRIFARVRKEALPPGADLSQPKDQPKPQPKVSGRVHVGWILGWVSVALTGAALGVAAVSGGNAYTNAQEATTMMRKARSNSYPQVLIEPLVNGLHGRATTYGLVANVSYGVAGATALGATGFFLWAYFASRTPKASGNASLRGSSTLFANSHSELP